MPKKEPLKLPDFINMNIPIISEVGTLESFHETSLYTDFENEINIRIQQLQELLEDTELMYSGRHYDLFRGGILCLRQMKDIFGDLARNKTDQITTTD